MQENVCRKLFWSVERWNWE